MAVIFNLNKFKKNQVRRIKNCQAKISRVKFGQTKVEKDHKKYLAQLEYKELSGKKIDDNGTDVA